MTNITPTMTIEELDHYKATKELPARFGDSERQKLIKTYESAPMNKADTKAEKHFQSEAESMLRQRYITALHLSMRAREKKGWPDLTFCLSGRPIALELKVPGNKLSENQVDVLANLKNDGWEVYVIFEWETFMDLINGHNVPQWEIPDGYILKRLRD